MMTKVSEMHEGDFKPWIWWLGALSNLAFAGVGYGIVGWSGIDLMEFGGAWVLFMMGFLWSQAICTYAIFRMRERAATRIVLAVGSFIGILIVDVLLWLPLFQVLAGVHC